LDPAAQKSVTDEEARAYFDSHKSEFERPGHARLSVVHIPRVISSADTLAVKERLLKLRAEIVGGAKFEDVARRESADSVSGANGGDLGRGARGRFVPQFETAAYKLKVGEISAPVLTPFGFHLIRLDSRNGDTLSLRHILLRIQQSDSAATITDRRADDLARAAASADDPKKFDAGAKQLGLTIYRVEAVENQPATLNGTTIPSVSAWAFGGARAGETSELFDDENGYWLARLDSVVPGGEPTFERAKAEIRAKLAREKALERLMPAAQQFSQNAAARGMEVAASSAKLNVIKTPSFTRVDFVPQLGRFSQPIGAAFGLAVGAVSAPIRDETGIYVLRVDRRSNASRAEFEKQKAALRQRALQQQRQNRVQIFLSDIRKSAKIKDNRKDINATARRAQS
jgi:peptidyl-prolyl cis-trans isomerase D